MSLTRSYSRVTVGRGRFNFFNFQPNFLNLPIMSQIITIDYRRRLCTRVFHILHFVLSPVRRVVASNCHWNFDTSRGPPVISFKLVAYSNHRTQKIMWKPGPTDVFLYQLADARQHFSKILFLSFLLEESMIHIVELSSVGWTSIWYWNNSSILAHYTRSTLRKVVKVDSIFKRRKEVGGGEVPQHQ